MRETHTSRTDSDQCLAPLLPLGREQGEKRIDGEFFPECYQQGNFFLCVLASLREPLSAQWCCGPPGPQSAHPTRSDASLRSSLRPGRTAPRKRTVPHSCNDTPHPHSITLQLNPLGSPQKGKKLRICSVACSDFVTQLRRSYFPSKPLLGCPLRSLKRIQVRQFLKACMPTTVALNFC